MEDQIYGGAIVLAMFIGSVLLYRAALNRHKGGILVGWTIGCSGIWLIALGYLFGVFGLLGITKVLTFVGVVLGFIGIFIGKLFGGK